MSCALTTLEDMQEHGITFPREPGDVGGGPYTGLEVRRLRDADWLDSFPALPVSQERTQVLYHWTLGPDQNASGLLYQPLDGNPRHGVLSLFVDQGELHGAIEIVERQGRWLVMPDDLRARTLAVAALARREGRPLLRSSIVGTPDRRFIFFNTLRDGGTATLVERRSAGGATVS